jgi:hypothetical protein
VRSVNDAVRFLLELALLAAFAYAGGTVGSATWLQIVVAIAAPCAVAAAWGAWFAPRASRRLPDPLRLALEVLLFAAGGGALAAAGQAGFGVALAVLGIANALLIRVAPGSAERN